MPPGGATVDPLTERDIAYCRAARRVRATHARRPARLYRELQHLGKWYTAARPPAPPPPATTPHSRAEAFALEVAARIEGPVLRQSQRRALFAAARRLGIGRFEANLVIAAVQHEVKRTAPRAAAPATPPAAARWLAPVATALALQAAIAWAAWHVCFG
jgi:hypothetical protein